MLLPGSGGRLWLPQPRAQRRPSTVPAASPDSPRAGPCRDPSPGPSARQPRGGTGPSGRRPARRLAALCLPLLRAGGAERSGAGWEMQSPGAPSRRRSGHTRATLPGQWLRVPT